MFGVDDALIGAGIGAVGNVIGGWLGKAGQDDANAANAQMAQKQMDFQERMSDTAYQRAVADMKKAGINPMLAVSQGGATTPGGSSAVMQNSSAPLASGLSSAFNAYSNYIDLDTKRRTNELLAHQSNTEMGKLTNLISQSNVYDAEAELKRSQIPGYHVERDIDTGKYGTILRYLNRLSPTVSSASSLADLANTISKFGKIPSIQNITNRSVHYL